MPADDSSRLDDRKCIENARCDPIKADEYEPIKVAEDRPLARPSTQHIQLVAQSEILNLKRRTRAKPPDQRRPDELQQVPHRAIYRPIWRRRPSGQDLRQRQGSWIPGRARRSP